MTNFYIDICEPSNFIFICVVWSSLWTKLKLLLCLLWLQARNPPLPSALCPAHYPCVLTQCSFMLVTLSNILPHLSHSSELWPGCQTGLYDCRIAADYSALIPGHLPSSTGSKVRKKESMIFCWILDQKLKIAEHATGGNARLSCYAALWPLIFFSLQMKFFAGRGTQKVACRG